MRVYRWRSCANQQAFNDFTNTQLESIFGLSGVKLAEYLHEFSSAELNAILDAIDNSCSLGSPTFAACVESVFCNHAIARFETKHGIDLLPEEEAELKASLPSCFISEEAIEVYYFSDIDNTRARICATSIVPEKLTDEDVEAWYFKLLNLSYIFHYVDPDDPYNTKAFNVNFGDLCINAPTHIIENQPAASIAFATAFELAVDQAVTELNEQPWDDLLLNLPGGELGIYPYITTLFRGKLEENLAFSFGGFSNTSTSICNGIQGFAPNFRSDCL